MTESYCIILTTVGSEDEAHRLADLLVTEKLAACIQISSITSYYMWKEKVNKDAEFLLLIKTVAHLYKDIEAAIVQSHSYEIPEVIQVPVRQGLDRYLGWIAENTR